MLLGRAVRQEEFASARPNATAGADHGPAARHGSALGLDQCSDDLKWWTCVGWTAPHDNELILCTGYAASDDLHKKHSEDYRHVPRRHHAGPPPDWPPPAAIVGDYVGLARIRRCTATAVR